MKKYFNLLVLGATCIGLNYADAAAKGLMKNPGASASAKDIKCSRTYCVKVELHTAPNSPGHLQIYKKNPQTKAYEDTKKGCSAIGGNPTNYPKDEALYTPSGVFAVYKHSNPLKYSNTGKRADLKDDPSFRTASYFYNPGVPSGNEVAVHTANVKNGYTENSHGCVRASCAGDVYGLSDAEVQVDYVD